MKLFIDCEFNGWNGELISMALVPEMGEPFYQVIDTAGMKIVPWVREHVMPILVYRHQGSYPISKSSFQSALAKYLNQWKEVTIVADWPDDIKYFCESIITGPGYVMPIPRLKFEMVRMDLESEVPHNALSDAYAVREGYRKTTSQWHQEFPVGVLGHPMREFSTGRWECAIWPSEQKNEV